MVLVQDKQKNETEYLFKKKLKVIDTSRPLIYDDTIIEGHLGFYAVGQIEYPYFKR